MDGRYKYLKYEYIEGNHSMLHISQFAMLLEDLQKIHDKRLVHSDIREVNIVFHSNGKAAKLIDFDLAASCGTPYPDNYRNDKIYERHPQAIGGYAREYCHDRYSLSKIMESFGVPSNYVERVNSQESLSVIAKQLKN